VTAADVASRIAGVEGRRRAAGEPAYAAAAVTAGPDETLVLRGGEGRGRVWGVVVHRALAGMGRGRTGDPLRRFVRALLLKAGRPVTPLGEPEELQELLEILERIRRSEVWRSLGSGPRELAVTRLEPEPGGAARLLSGAVDALALDGEGRPVRVVDWKTDLAEGEEWAVRERHYREQVEAYSLILQGLTGSLPDAEIVRVR
jgi:hypothetical protein